MENKKNKSLVVMIVVLSIVIVGLCIFIAYDKGIIFNKKSSDNVSDNKENKDSDDNKKDSEVKVDDESDGINNTDNTNNTVKELDINSSLVKQLYKKVSPYVDSDYSLWLYDYKDFYSDKATEEEKMKVVGMNLTQNVYTDNSGAPAKLDDFTILTTGKNGEAYTREYVDSIYKDIFGSSSVLNKDVRIFLNSNMLVYISSLDKYYKYGTEGTGGYNSYRNPKLIKAVQNGSELKIYESVEIYDDPINDTVKTSDCEFVYTFKIDSQNKYIFYSRVENK